MIVKKILYYRVDRPNLPVLQPGDKLLMRPVSTPEPCPENMKKNSPETEKKNMLYKFKDNMKTKLNRMTSEDPKNLLFSQEEIKQGEKGIHYVSPSPFQNKIIDSLDGQAKLWFGKDYTNFIIKDFTNLEAPYAG